MTKNEIAAVLAEIATLLELRGENPFKIRAYQTGARTLEGLEAADLERLVAAGELGTVKGFGEALVNKIATLHATGCLEFHEKLRASVPPGLLELLTVPGLGPKKIKVLHEKLGVDSPAALEAACRAGRVAELTGFGEKTQAKLIEGLAHRAAYARRHLWWDAAQVAAPLVAGLRALPQVRRAEAAGSLRRGAETVGDLDFIVATAPGDVEPVVAWFCAQPDVQAVTARGDTKASVRFTSGLQADLRLVPLAQFAYALHHFTGSKDHNVALRQRALARGLSLSEWGLVPETGEGTAKEKAERGLSLVAETEAELFAHLGLAYIPPERREAVGEIELTERGALPEAVRTEDLRGAWHNHTTESDGANTLTEMVAAAQALGWRYLGIADHSKSSVQAQGLSAERLAGQIATIRALNASGRHRTHVFAGVECDILTDGALDYDDATLAALGLDYLVASVHSAFSQDEATMTARIIRAIEHPRVTMVGHVTGRLLLRREAYRVNLDKVIDAAIAHRVILELNASPWRLDLEWRRWARAAERGLMCALNPDAHDTAGLAHVACGVNAARKAGLVPAQVLNTRDRAGVERWFRERR
jgi:DNA polymerase (family X)